MASGNANEWCCCCCFCGLFSFRRLPTRRCTELVVDDVGVVPSLKAGPCRAAEREAPRYRWKEQTRVLGRRKKTEEEEEATLRYYQHSGTFSFLFAFLSAIL